MIPAEVQQLHAAGWSLIPVGPDKKALVAWKPYQSEKASLELVEQWQQQHRPAIWAGVTGAVSNVFSLDFDMPSGPDTLHELGLPAHRSTPSGGRHTDVMHPGWQVGTVSGTAKKSLAAAYPGLDVRGDGGYINLFGQTATGGYRWLSEDRVPLALEVLPPPLREALGLERPPVPVVGTTKALVPQPRQPVDNLAAPGVLLPGSEQLVGNALGRIGLGGRNEAGFWLACQLRDDGTGLADAERAMQAFAAQVPAVNSKGTAEPYPVAEALASLRQAYQQPARARWERLARIIVTDRQLRDLSRDAVAALVARNDPPRLFMRGGAVTRLLRDEHARVRCEPLRADGLRHELSLAADWLRTLKGGGEANTNPPMPVANDLLVRDWDELPRLTGLLDAPCLRPDGSLLDQPGYDQATGLWLDPDGLSIPPVPSAPSDEEIEAALGLLQELLSEFAFADEPSRANALAFVLTAALRPAIAGLVPLALVKAPIMSSGKTFLVNIAALVASGRPARLTAAPGRDDEELRKRLTSLLIQGEPMIVFDNVSAPLTSSVLAQALTATAWSDRILGASTMVSLEPKVSWAATGNNIQLGGDLGRRCYPISLDPRMATPWKREYRRPDLEEWALAERGRLLAAVFTLARGWYDRGQPSGSAPQLASYRQWTTMMAGILATAGVTGFLDNLGDLTETDDGETSGWRRLLTAWRDVFGAKPVSTAEVGGLIASRSRELELPPSLAASIACCLARQRHRSGRQERPAGP